MGCRAGQVNVNHMRTVWQLYLRKQDLLEVFFRFASRNKKAVTKHHPLPQAFTPLLGPSAEIIPIKQVSPLPGLQLRLLQA